MLNWDNLLIVAMADASHSNEFEVVGTHTEAYRSQSGRILMLASKDILNGDDLKYHMMNWSSTIIRRVSRSTMQAETYSMSNMVEEADKFRAKLADNIFTASLPLRGREKLQGISRCYGSLTASRCTTP